MQTWRGTDAPGLVILPADPASRACQSRGLERGRSPGARQQARDPLSARQHRGTMGRITGLRCIIGTTITAGAFTGAGASEEEDSAEAADADANANPNIVAIAEPLIDPGRTGGVRREGEKPPG